MKRLTSGSLFNGIGGWILASERNGVDTLWESEIDEYCEGVVAKHFPYIKQLGNVVGVKVEDLEPVDIICAGSPCNNLSISGDKTGLEGEQSGLFREAIRIVHGLKCLSGGGRWFVWENVANTLSSNKGMDFRAVLEEISKSKIPMPLSGKWAGAGVVRGRDCEIEWRLFNSKYFGVPHTRERLFLVADFCPAKRGGRSVLFEAEGLPGDIAESEGTRKIFTGDSNYCFDDTGYSGVKHIPIENYPNDSRIKVRMDGTIQTLNAWMGTGGNNVPLVIDVWPDGQKKIRKLTPVECERLQQIPDGFTDVPQGVSNAKRYKALGNGMTQGIADWVISRIVEVENAV